MGPEIWVTIAAVFVSGGAIGTAGTLLAQWLLTGMDGHGRGRARADPEVLRREIALMNRHLRNLEARVDFTEQLLGGAITATRPPEPLPSGEGGDAENGPTEAAPPQG